ncbi:MAG TPA: excinuclease ABC subunit UvrC [Terriglobales bacterium]|nr:excinuclease ABC subunit UvrC [Terriglobales bacterium]
MDLHQKIRTLPASPGVYLYKNAEGEVLYVGKANSLRARVRSYFAEGAAEDAKTGSLLREAVDLDYIVVDNEKEALALENNLIKQKQPRFNILLRDDKTYPYIKLTLGERFPRVYVTRRLKQDGSAYYGPYFPANLAHRVADLIHRHFLVPSCTVDLTHFHPRPCLQYHIRRCLGPCVQGLTTDEIYQEAVRDLKLFLEGRPTDLAHSLKARMEQASAAEEYERAAKYRDLISTLTQLSEKQRMAAVAGDDADLFGYHFEEQRLAVNLFHMRGGRILDRREFFWEDLPEVFSAPSADSSALSAESSAPSVNPSFAPSAAKDPDRRARREPTQSSQSFDPAVFFSALLKQVYIGQPYVPRNIYLPVDFDDRAALEELLAESRDGRVEIHVPQRGEKRSLLDLAARNAKQSYDQRFRVLQPATRAIQQALQDALTLPELPHRIECFDISHIQGAETVASMVVWEDGKMKKSDYRKFLIKSVEGVDDFAAMREVVARRYKRLQAEQKNDKQKMPSLILVDGGLGQLHAAAQALESLQIVHQPLAAIAKREEIIYVHGQEDEPLALDRHSPVLHLIQRIRDESHRFAVTFHRKRRQMRDRASELLEIPGIGETTRRRLLEHFGSVQAVKAAGAAALAAVVTRPQAEAILGHFRR